METLTEVSNDESSVPRSESPPKFFPEGISLSGEEFDPTKHMASKHENAVLPSPSPPHFIPEVISLSTEQVDPKKHLVSKNEYTIPGPSPSSFFPEGISLSGEEFDPKKHLQLEPPTHIKDMTFKTVPFPFDAKQRAIKGNLAYTAPFRVLSDEGVAAARRALDRNQHLAKSNPRASCYVRGLGYASRFHRDLAYDPTLTKMLNELARYELAIHGMTMSVSHTNVGQIATGRPVDAWHTDSFEYVLVIILSDVEEMQGGSMRVLQMPDASGEMFKELTIKGVPDDLVEEVRYGRAGEACFMQGSKILHTVDAVLKAREPRISLVNSYTSLRPFAPDPTRYGTFTQGGFGDDSRVASVEFARHKAWRAKGKLQYVLDQISFSGDSTDTTSELVNIFEEAAAELQRAADLMSGKIDDNAKWLDPAGREKRKKY
jgi:hypothetical protein